MKKAKGPSNRPTLPRLPGGPALPEKNEPPPSKASVPKNTTNTPENLGKAIRLPVPDFSNPQRGPTCLEVDFPIVQINALAKIEVSSGPARKRIYCMSKWWARRASSVFRAMLIAAATEAPGDPTEAAKLVWDHYYCNHQKAGSFKKLKVLDCFMGGGTTLVEGSRLGMRMTGNDLNPVAWFVVKNELACSDPEQVKALFVEIEKQVKPQVQPFYTTTCPRGHRGRWIDERTGEAATIDPIDLSPEARHHYRWEGPEVIYTFWAKHGPCQAKGCGHRTPIFKSPLIAEKSLSTQYLEMHCSHCGVEFQADLGETRMAPGAERVVLADEPLFTELSQPVARLFKEYDQGNDQDTLQRIEALLKLLPDDPGLSCPQCGQFAGQRLLETVQRQFSATRAGERKKKFYAIKKKAVQMHLLIHPAWLRGTSGFDEQGHELGGWAGASPESTARWYERRGENLRLVEVRGENLPDAITLKDGTKLDTQYSTVPEESSFLCAHCGQIFDIADAERKATHHSPVAAYALQCYCPECDNEGYTYSGRYFITVGEYDRKRIIASLHEWDSRADNDLNHYWPRSALPYAWETHVQKGNLTLRGYTHWWKMFNARQLLVHAQLLKALMDIPEDRWPTDVREQALGAWQEYSRHQSMFCFWDIQQDCLAPMLANANFHPKTLLVENNIWLKIGRANWASCLEGVISGVEWAIKPTEIILNEPEAATKSIKVEIADPIIPKNIIHCGSSTDLSMLGNAQFDLVITDPPFGNNLFYADLADFFYVWLRIPLRKWYAGLPEAAFFEPEFTPKALQAIDDPAQHPEDREAYEKAPLIETKHLAAIRKITGANDLNAKDPNPLYRPQPSSDFYCRTLSASWAEAGRLLKDGGILAFTFHHNEDQAWVDVLKALFDAGYLLVATYPIRSDETKGDAANAAFGSKKIEYDIIHVCRKRLKEPEPVAWARMRRWVKEEAEGLKELLEHTHGQSLPEPDLRVILRGKSLEFYSRHYGQVFTGDGQLLEVRDALLGINQLLDDILESKITVERPPDSAEPASRLFLSLFKKRSELARDDLHKRLRGTGISPADLEAKGWLRIVGKQVYAVPLKDRFAFFMEPGRNRKVIKTDLDQAHFCLGAVLNGMKLDDELDNPNFRVKKSVDDILVWFANEYEEMALQLAARAAVELLARWRARLAEKKLQDRQPTLFDYLEAMS